jgi:hypothetical protein
MLAVLEMTDNRVYNAVSDEDAHRWSVFHSYATLSYVISLRGTEGLLLDLKTLHRFWGTGKEEVYSLFDNPFERKTQG